MPQTKNIHLLELNTVFDTEEDCIAYLEKLRWPNGIRCPRCDSEKISRIQKRNQFDCDSCRYQFSVKSGTIFHDSHLPLPKWFLATYLMLESKKGISSNQMRRMLKVSPKTAWYLCHRIRKAIAEEKIKPQLDGTVEVDKTFLGGRHDKRRKREPWDKQAVIGLLQRDVKFIPTRSRQILTGIVRERVEKSSKVLTDEYSAYDSLKKTHKHNSVNHSAEEWVHGNIHTNGIENAWSLFKRSVVGAFHQVSEKHLDAYLNEFEWRFNNRNNPFLFRDTLTRLLSSVALQYKVLTKTA
ncbi:MAG: IS1595 family transposase [Acidobacteria bacterium]|nr:IS1595 family transposase [Acidobacteriota bacterium]